MKNIQEDLKLAATALAEVGIDRSQSEARLLMSHVLGCRIEEVSLRDDQRLSEVQHVHWTRLLKERLSRKPMSQIVGERHFYESKFLVNENVLSPRPESESLLEKIFSWIEENNLSSGKILELGVGSGCLILSLQKKLGSRWKCVGLEKSSLALQVAQRNAERLGIKNVDWIESDLFTWENSTDWTIILSNPPYIPQEDLKNLEPEVRDFEPLMALDGGVDGCHFYRKIFRDYYPKLQRNGLLILETYDEPQREILRKEWSRLWSAPLNTLDCHIWAERKEESCGLSLD
jgi:release factor glutamine methyltransferase